MDAPRRLNAEDHDLVHVLDLIRASFAFMDGVIDPPSSMHRLTLESLSQSGEVWAIGHPVTACVVLTPKPRALYIGKLAVDQAQRGSGSARKLIEMAAERGRALGYDRLELQVRVELTGNQAAFTRMGFSEVARTAHAGYDRPTSITYQRML